MGIPSQDRLQVEEASSCCLRPSPSHFFAGGASCPVGTEGLAISRYFWSLPEFLGWTFAAHRPLQVVKSFQDSSCTVPDIVVLFSKKTRIGFFVNKHQPCQQVDCGETYINKQRTLRQLQQGSNSQSCCRSLCPLGQKEVANPLKEKQFQNAESACLDGVAALPLAPESGTSSQKERAHVVLLSLPREGQRS
ncbi:hypothetical protein CB1_000917023 [Camelus ferus]|nr:hypothetical protein CB1_000917023 [Camelus ferus]